MPPDVKPIESPPPWGLNRVLAWGLALGFFVFFFGPLKVFLLGLLAGASVAATLKPLADRVPGNRVARAVLTACGFIAMVGGVAALAGWLLIAPMRQETAAWPQIKEGLNQTLATWGHAAGVVPPPDVDSLARPVVDFLIGQDAQTVFTRAASLGATVVIVFVFVFAGSIFLLAEPRGRLLKPLVSLLPEHRRGVVQAMVTDLEPKLRGWLLGTLVGMAAVGVLDYIGFLIVGLNFALPLAMLMALSVAVPTVGPLTGLLITLFFAFSQGGSTALGVAIVFVIAETLVSYILLPVIMHRAVDIPPVVTLFTVILWGQVFGVAGLLLAVPIDLVVWSALQHFVARRVEPQLVVEEEPKAAKVRE